MNDRILAVEGVSKRFGGLQAVREASLTVDAGRITARDRAEWRGQDHPVRDDHRLPDADRRAHPLQRR